MKASFLTRRVVQPVVNLLKQGVTPEKLALSIALGATFGIFPALGWTTALCAIIALVFELNLPAIQMVNYFMYPVQVALLIPFFRMGEQLFRAQHLPLSLAQISTMLQASIWGTIGLLWTTTWHAMVVWALIAPFFTGLVYLILVPLLRRILKRQSGPTAEAA
jgi:uncharacterized protein (DUF2062 family)